jgi:predicted AAA+ superfamily ATPase
LVGYLPRYIEKNVSYNALREDLQVSHQSVARWIGMLEKLYMIFRIYSFVAPLINDNYLLMRQYGRVL